MGLGHNNNLACLDCGVSYNLGYGYSGNTIRANSLEGFDSYSGSAFVQTAWRNLAHRFALMLHDGHHCQQWLSDVDGWQPYANFAWMDMELIVSAYLPRPRSQLESFSVGIDSTMVEHGPTWDTEARQLVLREALRSFEVVDICHAVVQEYRDAIDHAVVVGGCAGRDHALGRVSVDSIRIGLILALNYFASGRDPNDCRWLFRLAAARLVDSSIDRAVFKALASAAESLENRKGNNP